MRTKAIVRSSAGEFAGGGGENRESGLMAYPPGPSLETYCSSDSSSRLKSSTRHSSRLRMERIPSSLPLSSATGRWRKWRSSMVVSASPGLTAKWLVPRIYRFLARHPDVDTRISAGTAYSNFTTDGVDVGIRLSSGVHPELHVEKLSDEWMLPLCSPRLLEGEHPLRSPHDLPRFPLIQIDLPGLVPTWDDWLRAVGIEGIDTTRGLRLNVADHALDAASEGTGVVLGYKLVASHDIGLGRLVVPFGPELPLPGRSYHFVCARGQERRPAIKAFRDWLFAEIQDTFATLRRSGAGPAPRLETIAPAPLGRERKIRRNQK